MKNKYVVIYEPDGDNWMVTIPGSPNGVHCVTWGSSIAQARGRAREALAACLDDEAAATAAVFVERFA